MATNDETIEIGGQYLRWTHDTSRSPAILYHALINGGGEVVSSAPLPEDAVKMAKYRILPKLGRRMSFEDFRAVVLVLPVVPGQAGVRYESPNRFLIDDAAAGFPCGTGELRKEALRSYDCKDDNKPADRAKFVGDFVSAVLGSCSEPNSTSIHIACGPDIRPIVLLNMRSCAVNMTMDSVMKSAYDIFLADSDDASHRHAKPRAR